MSAHGNIVDFIDAHYERTFGGAFDRVLHLEDVLRKTDDPAVSSDTGMGTAVCTAGIFYQLNYKSPVVSVLPRKPLTGEKIKIITTDEATGAGISEGGALVDSDVPVFAEITLPEKEVMNRWQVTDKADRKKRYRPDAVGAAEIADYYRVRHPKVIQNHFMQDMETLAGDNFESLDRLISSYAEISGCGYTAGDADPWTEAISGVNRDAAASDIYDSQVLEYDSTPEALTLTKIQTLIEQTQDFGAEPERQLFVCPKNVMRRWKALVAPGQRFGEWHGEKSMVNGVESEGGMKGGVTLQSWEGIPIVTVKSADMPSESDEAGRLFLLDLDNIGFWMSLPTTVYSEDSRVANDFLGVDSIVVTAGELVCTKFSSQGKIRDIL